MVNRKNPFVAIYKKRSEIFVGVLAKEVPGRSAAGAGHHFLSKAHSR